MNGIKRIKQLSKEEQNYYFCSFFNEFQEVMEDAVIINDSIFCYARNDFEYSAVLDHNNKIIPGTWEKESLIIGE